MPTPAGRDYLHFTWMMPGRLPSGPAESLQFHIISTEMLLSGTGVFVEGLVGVIDERNVNILRQAVQNLLQDPKHGPQQIHVIVFASAETDSSLFLQAGGTVLFGLLEKRWPGKTISLIPVPYSLFEKIQEVATGQGFWPTPPPSMN